MSEIQPIAICTVTNVMGLAIYEISDEQVLVGVNNEKPVEVEIQWNDDGEPYIDFYGEHMLNEFVKTNL